MGKVTVIGSLNMDLVVTSPKMPAMGETLLGSGFMTVPGGKGANQAVAAARLGGEVSMVGCVGDDLFGRDLLKNLQINGVNIKSVKTVKDCSTGVAMIVVCNGDNFIIVDAGANSKLTPEMIDDAEELIKSSDIVVLQLEIPYQTVERAIEIASRNKVKILLNPAPARELPDELLSKVDILTPNESECSFIAGRKVQSIKDAEAAIDVLRKKGAKNVIVTMGKNGSVFNNGMDIIHMAVPEVKAVDTTAAGDCFSGAVAVALSDGKALSEAVEFGNKAGSLTVMKKGAQISLPSLADIENYEDIIRENQKPVPV